MAAAILAAAGAMALTAAAAGAETIYSSIPTPLPGNFASIGFEATSTAEFGGEVSFVGTARKNPKVSVVMSSWTCENGNISEHNCTTAGKSSYQWPITFGIYEVGPGGSVGAKIGAGSKTFKIPYRPSENDKKCTGELLGAWYDTRDKQCFSALAFKLSLPLKVAKLPEKAIITVAFDTQTYGAHPTGESGPENSLNVAIAEPEEHIVTTGTPGETYVSSTYNEMYCGSSADLGTFAAAGACWEGFQPIFAVSASS
jgi:hypothetical protein